MARMTVDSLIEILEEVKKQHGDMEVRLAHQPRWAFEYAVNPTCGVAKIKDEFKGDIKAFYLAEGIQIGYLPQSAALAVDWSEQKDDEESLTEGEDFQTYGWA